MPHTSDMDIVTGGLSYIGKYITRRLVSEGRQVLILTGHPNRKNPFGNQVKIAPFNFDNQRELIRSLQGATTLYNTYWVRFDHGQISFDKAIEHTRCLIAAAKEANIQKIVHLSVSNPSEDSPFPYFRGKAVLEKAVVRSRMPYVIIRPTLVYGGEEEILVNNIAWLLRRFPLFTLPSQGNYRLQPISIEDLAAMAVNAAQNTHNIILDAAGPDILTFEEMVRLIAMRVGGRSLIFKVSPGLSLILLKIVGMMVRDVVLTPDELGALRDELLVSSNHATGQTRFSNWLNQKAHSLGQRYASELDRHYR